MSYPKRMVHLANCGGRAELSGIRSAHLSGGDPVFMECEDGALRPFWLRVQGYGQVKGVVRFKISTRLAWCVGHVMFEVPPKLEFFGFRAEDLRGVDFEITVVSKEITDDFLVGIILFARAVFRGEEPEIPLRDAGWAGRKNIWSAAAQAAVRSRNG